MRSFITSYLGATESNTLRTRCAFSASSTDLNPKCVVAMVSSCPLSGCRRHARPSRASGHRGPHRLQRHDAHLAFAGLQHLLARAVALHLGRRGIHPHQLEGNAELAAVGKADLEHAGLAVHRDVLRGRGVLVESCHGCLRLVGDVQTSTRSMPPWLAWAT